MPYNDRQIDSTGGYTPPAKLESPWLFEDQIAHNKRGTFMLMICFSLVLIGMVYAIGVVLNSGTVAYIMAAVAAVISFFMSYYSYYYSDQLVLTMSQAYPATKEEYPHLVNTLEGLTLAAGLPAVPRAFVIFDPAPNAFATGRDPQHAAVAVTTGLLKKLDRYQLEGVLAHELSHVANRDILLSTVAAVMVGVIVLLGDWAMRAMFFGGIGGDDREDNNSGGSRNPVMIIIAIIAIILAPIIATLMQLAISRNREYLADANAVKLTRYPDGLAGALAAISADTEPLAVANKATAQLYISNPLLEHKSWLNNMFSTHPPIDERIARIKRM
ncbi:MAG: M48 family metalloprotease [bacterium]